MKDRGGVAVSYSGVHQAYQLALAAHEAGVLDRFYCSLFVAPGKWGSWAQRWFGPARLINRHCQGIPAEQVDEYPWPLLRHRLKSRLFPEKANEWHTEADAFDRWAAARLARSRSRVFVGTETCAQHSFQAAKRLEMLRVMDCPQVHPGFLERMFRLATQDIGITIPAAIDSTEMAARKAQEFQQADWLLVCSEVAKRSFVEAGFSAEKLVVTPLWVDPQLWFPDSERRLGPNGPLRVLFVGGLSLRKGIPYLLEAVRRCGRAVQLTLVGDRSAELEAFLASEAESFVWVRPQTKSALRKIYCEHEVLVLPSLADSFGFVALEAMACGLPVIVTENCGVPVPDRSWRVPVMDSEAIARRLEYYAGDREALESDGLVAQRFARQFSPERYRAQIRKLFYRLLRETNGAAVPCDAKL